MFGEGGGGDRLTRDNERKKLKLNDEDTNTQTDC
jgi:hypothetical protein